jgi:hypothetical protein
MSHIFPNNIVAALLGMSVDTVQRSLELFRSTGDVVLPPTGKKRGRKPILEEEDLNVSAIIPSDNIIPTSSSI